MLYTTSNYNSGIPNFGVSHADELFFLWNNLIGIEFKLFDEFDTLVSKYFTTMWSNFVKFGDQPDAALITISVERAR